MPGFAAAGQKLSLGVEVHREAHDLVEGCRFIDGRHGCEAWGIGEQFPEHTQLMAIGYGPFPRYVLAATWLMSDRCTWFPDFAGNFLARQIQ
jgi:hypothetical protein